MLIRLRDDAKHLSYAYGNLLFRKGEKQKVNKETGQYLLSTGLFIAYEDEEDNQSASKKKNK